MENLLQDIRYGARVLLNRPGFTIVAVLTLAIGIGANSAIFSVVNGVLLRPLPYEEPGELVMVWQDHTRIEGPLTEWLSPDNFFDIRDQGGDVFEGAFALDGFAPTLTGADGPEMLSGASASYNGFEVLGVEPILGRRFRPEEDAPGGDFVVILGYDLWQRRFGGDDDVIGTTLTLGGGPATVVGVMPPGFRLPVIPGADIFAPLRIDRTNSCGRGCVTLRGVARVRDGVSIEEAGVAMDALAARLEQEFPGANSGVGVYLQPLHDAIVGPYRAGLLLLAGAVGFVLLIACANVANLMLARATGREREVAIRVAMGAGQARVFRQMLTESLMLAIAGAGIGLLFALWGVDLLVSLVPSSVPRFAGARVDAAALAFTLLISVATGLLFGLAPALRASRPQLNESLKEGGRGYGAGRGGQRARASLVVVQVALALTLLFGGGLLMRSFVTLVSVDPGFEADNLLTQQIFLRSDAYPDEPARIAFVDRLRETVSALPGVEGANVINVLPMGGNNVDANFLIEGRPEPAVGERRPVAWYRPVSAGYFEMMQMGLVRGRWFSESDDGEAPPVVLMNETAVSRYWPDEEALGSRVIIGGAPREVVGIVADTKHFGLDRDARPAMYFPYKQITQPFMSLIVRTSGDPMLLARAVQGAVWQIDPDMAVAGVATMGDVIAATSAVIQGRLMMVLLIAFAGSALALAAIGLYGTMSYSVGQRTQEIGLRMALGAKQGDVVRQVIGRGMVLLSIGTGIGMVAAFLLSRFIESLLFEVGATDPMTFAAVPAILALVALIACWVAARRAARVDPVVALRRE